MYASKESAQVGDIVSGSGDSGEVLEVTPNGLGGEEMATVQWKSPRQKSPGINAPLAPVSVPTRSLTLVRRKSDIPVIDSGGSEVPCPRNAVRYYLVR